MKSFLMVLCATGLVLGLAGCGDMSAPSVKAPTTVGKAADAEMASEKARRAKLR